MKNYALRRSKNKEYFCWVLESIEKNDNSFHCGVKEKKIFDEWFNSLDNNINNERVIYFMKVIQLKKEN